MKDLKVSDYGSETSSRSNNKVIIILPSSKDSYFGGETVNGQIHAFVESSTVLLELILSFDGVERINISQQEHINAFLKKTVELDFNPFTMDDVTNYDVGHYSKEFLNLEKGTYNIPFFINIPCNIPPSFNNECGAKIEYTLSALLKCQEEGKEEQILKAIEVVTIRGSLISGQVLRQEEIQNPSAIVSKTLNFGNVSCIATIPSNIVKTDSELRVLLQLKKQSQDKHADICVKLERHTRIIKEENLLFEDSSEISHYKAGNAKVGNDFKADLGLSIPHFVNESIPTAIKPSLLQFIHLNYLVRVIITFSERNCVDLAIPIYLIHNNNGNQPKEILLEKREAEECTEHSQPYELLEFENNKNDSNQQLEDSENYKEMSAEQDQESFIMKLSQTDVKQECKVEGINEQSKIVSSTEDHPKLHSTLDLTENKEVGAKLTKICSLSATRFVRNSWEISPTHKEYIPRYMASHSHSSPRRVRSASMNDTDLSHRYNYENDASNTYSGEIYELDRKKKEREMMTIQSRLDETKRTLKFFEEMLEKCSSPKSSSLTHVLTYNSNENSDKEKKVSQKSNPDSSPSVISQLTSSNESSSPGTSLSALPFVNDQISNADNFQNSNLTKSFDEENFKRLEYSEYSQQNMEDTNAVNNSENVSNSEHQYEYRYIGTRTEKIVRTQQKQVVVHGEHKIIQESLNIPDGEYDGELNEDVPHGQGTMVYSNGSIYSGFWKYGKKHGKGKMIYSDNAVYEGSWFEDERQGWGFYKTNSYKYDGNWFRDMKHGKGVILYNNGEHFKGYWLKNQPDKEGIYVSNEAK